MNREWILEELERRLERVPPQFRDDGCSAPRLLRWVLDWLFDRLHPACRVHDHWYCTRAWPPGRLTQHHRYEADKFLGESARALLPFGARWTGWGVHRAVDWWGGRRAYDSCDREDPGVGPLCRHGLP